MRQCPSARSAADFRLGGGMRLATGRDYTAREAQAALSCRLCQRPFDGAARGGAGRSCHRAVSTVLSDRGNGGAGTAGGTARAFQLRRAPSDDAAAGNPLEGGC